MTSLHHYGSIYRQQEALASLQVGLPSATEPDGLRWVSLPHYASLVPTPTARVFCVTLTPNESLDELLELLPELPAEVVEQWQQAYRAPRVDGPQTLTGWVTPQPATTDPTTTSEVMCCPDEHPLPRPWDITLVESPDETPDDTTDTPTARCDGPPPGEASTKQRWRETSHDLTSLPPHSGTRSTLSEPVPENPTPRGLPRLNSELVGWKTTVNGQPLEVQHATRSRPCLRQPRRGGPGGETHPTPEFTGHVFGPH